MVNPTWSFPRISSWIASFRLDVVTWPHAKENTLRILKITFLSMPTLCPIGRAPFQHMSFKLGELATSFLLFRYPNILNHTRTNHLLRSKIIDSLISNTFQSSSHLAYWPKATFSYCKSIILWNWSRAEECPFLLWDENNLYKMHSS
jgi:hypothetical protein